MERYTTTLEVEDPRGIHEYRVQEPSQLDVELRTHESVVKH